MPELSIIIPAYNSGRYIGQTISSILNQTWQDFELIIINDGSTDNTADIVNSFNNSRISYYENAENSGIVFSRNRGLDLATGNFIGMVDADDIVYPHKFQVQIDFLKRNPEYGMVGAWTKFIDAEGKSIPGGWKLDAPANRIPALMLFKNYFVQSAVLYKRDCIKNYRFREGFDILEDYLIWLEILERFKAGNINDYLLKYRKHNQGVTKTRTAEMAEKERKVFRYQLAKIDIVPTEKELDLHMLIRDDKLITEIKTLKEIEAWLLKILNMNKEANFYDENELMRVIFNRWIKSCHKAKALRLKMPYTMVKSEITYFPFKFYKI